MAERKKHYLIKNIHEPILEPHFSWNAFNIMVFLLLWFTGICVMGIQFGYNAFSARVGIACALPLLFIAGTFWLRRWEIGFVIFFLSSAFIGALLSMDNVNPFTIGLFIGIYAFSCSASTMIQMTREWERAIILRLGRFKAVKGPRVFLILPFFDSVSDLIDIRTRVTDFCAETTLTRDSVPITVDALCFWLKSFTRNTSTAYWSIKDSNNRTVTC